MTKVYISSTYLDLKDCREKVRLVLRRMGLEDVAMEYYVAGAERPVEKCLADVAACDLYVGLFAWRHGFVPKKKNRRRMSVTEMEYRKAVEAGKPRLIFLLDEEAPWPVKLIDEDMARIKKLRAELGGEDNLVSYFRSAAELGEVLAPAVHNWLKEHGRVTPVASPPELDLTAYYTALLKRYQRIDLNALTPPEKEEYLQLQLRQVFVAQSVRENPPPVELPKELWDKLRREGELHHEDLPAGVAPEEVLSARAGYYEKTAQPVIEVITDPRHKYLIVLGDPGAGKSTLARYVLLSLVGEEGDERLRRAFEGHVPMLIELRNYAGLYAERKCESFTEFLAALGRSEGWGVEREALEHYLKTDGRALVIFDGLDEIFDPEQREQIARRIVGFTNEYTRARLLVTSRVIGYRRKILSDAGFAHFTLQDLDERQVSEFASRWYELALSDQPDEAAARRERILRAFRESPSIRQLAGNPMLLTIMAIIGKHRELPRERWKLYEHAASVLVQQWDVHKHLRDRSIDAPYIEEDDKKELLRRLAFHMQAGEGGLAGNYIHRDQLQAEFEGYLADRYKLPPAQAKPVAHAMIDQFRSRNFILSLYGANVYGFVHRAFLEYFCATAFVHKFEKTQELTPDQLKQLYGQHWHDRAWHEVLRLICGILDEKFAGDLIDYLVTEIKPPIGGWSEGWPPWNIALAIQCLGEVRNLGTVTAPARKVLNAVCSLLESQIMRPTGLLSFMNDPVGASVEAIGSSWPEKSYLAEWLKRLRPDSNAWIYATSFGRIVGSVGAGVEEIHQIILSVANSSRDSHRALVTHALAVGWHDDPATAALLRTYVVEDQSWLVRYTSLKALVRQYREDATTLSLLRERATEDGGWVVRHTAIRALQQYYPQDAGTLPLLHTVAKNDEHSLVRQEAQRCLTNLEKEGKEARQ